MKPKKRPNYLRVVGADFEPERPQPSMSVVEMPPLPDPDSYKERYIDITVISDEKNEAVKILTVNNNPYTQRMHAEILERQGLPGEPGKAYSRIIGRIGEDDFMDKDGNFSELDLRQLTQFYQSESPVYGLKACIERKSNVPRIHQIRFTVVKPEVLDWCFPDIDMYIKMDDHTKEKACLESALEKIHNEYFGHD